MANALIRFLFCWTFFLMLSACGSSRNDTPANTDGSGDPQAIDPQVLRNLRIDRPAGNSVLNRSLPFTQDNSITYCESRDGDIESYSGYRDLGLYPLASLSKVFVSAWALQKLGPEHKFSIVWKLKPVPGVAGVYDAYLRSNYDPAMNIEKILYSLSQLQKKGVIRIRELTIDETTRVYLSVFSNPHIELDDVPVSSKQSLDNLRLILNSQNWSTQTQKAQLNLQAWAKSKNISLQIPNAFSVERVRLVEAAAIPGGAYTESVVIKSALLLKYLKNINVSSNNYMTDALFQLLGGRPGFRQFQTQYLKSSVQDLNLYTGSGLPINVNGQRYDNLGTCVSVLRTLQFLDFKSQTTKVNLGHVLLSAGQDDGTFESDLSFTNDVVLKTGRLYDVPTLNVAGAAALSTTSRVYFAFMAHGFDNSFESVIKNKRDQLIQSLRDFYPTQSVFKTTPQDEIFISL